MNRSSLLCYATCFLTLVSCGLRESEVFEQRTAPEEIHVLRDTWWKARAEDSSILLPNEKCKVLAGAKFLVKERVREGVHERVVLQEAVPGCELKQGYFYFEHISIKNEKLSLKNVGVDQTTYPFQDLAWWKGEIAKYSLRHYGSSASQLVPKRIVMHYTAGSKFPVDFTRARTPFREELPGLSCHFVVQADKIYQVLPTDVRSRCQLGANHEALGIEMVALNAADLAKKKDTLYAAARLVRALMNDFGISAGDVYSHEDVDASVASGVVPWVKDLVMPAGSGKTDPGAANMKTLMDTVKSLQ